MKTTNYRNTFILIAEDCPVSKSEIPQKKSGKDTVASIQYEMIKKQPYKYTSDEVIFNVFIKKNGIDKKDEKSEREKFFAKNQACLRSSPLGKRYGWGIHHNNEEKIAIYPVESSEYKKLSMDKVITKLKAMRSKRA